MAELSKLQALYQRQHEAAVEACATLVKAAARIKEAELRQASVASARDTGASGEMHDRVASLPDHLRKDRVSLLPSSFRPDPSISTETSCNYRADRYSQIGTRDAAAKLPGTGVGVQVSARDRQPQAQDDRNCCMIHPTRIPLQRGHIRRWHAQRSLLLFLPNSCGPVCTMVCAGHGRMCNFCGTGADAKRTALVVVQLAVERRQSEETRVW